MTKTQKGIAALTVGALGVVFGDIGTSPLYALRVVFGEQSRRLSINQLNVFGVISLIIWSITLVVSIKFIAFIMRADNEGEGGIMALVAMVRSSKLQKRSKWFFILIGLIGVSFFYGDGAITPAISVLSSVEGLKVVTSNLDAFIVPISLAILLILFWLQKYGTGLVGKLFGPIMALWFITIAAGGLWHVLQYPEVLKSLSPWTAINFFIAKPILAFTAMTAVVLAITGAEALYADMGHFGRPPIARAWFFLVFPSLTLCYMGQGAMLVQNPNISGSLLVQLFPSTIRLPIVVLATIAAIIASQAVISGTFSLTRQAVQLNFLPKMLIHHTSTKEAGQIYVPFVNIMLFIAVVILVISFGSSEKLGNAYGIAVSLTLAADSILFLVVLRTYLRKSLAVLAMVALLFIPIDLLFISSNLQKVWHGGLYPITIGALAFLLINTWVKGETIIDKERTATEGPIQDFIDEIHNSNPPLDRVPGSAVYIGHHPALAPIALRATVEDLHELPEKSIVLSVTSSSLAHIPEVKRAEFDDLGYDDGISHLTLSYGFHDTINIPKTLDGLKDLNPELNINTHETSYIISQTKPIVTKRHNLSHWRKLLYCLMARNAVSNSDYYKLPIERTEEMSTLIKL